MKLADLLKVALDEIRMQMLGIEVFLGFHLNAPFQSEFPKDPNIIRVAACALYLFIATLALLVAVPCQHRLVEKGEDDPRIFNLAQRFAALALFPLGLAVACDVYVVVANHSLKLASFVAVAVAVFAFGCWYALGYVLARGVKKDVTMPEKTSATLHTKIDQMLTEARVILPGAQALLGFQLIVTMTRAFSEMSGALRGLHLAALLAVAVAVVLLLAPAAVHRITFKGMDDARFHTIGSTLLTIALAPLALGITADTYVATMKMFNDAAAAAAGAGVVFILLFGLWYGAPLAIKHIR